MNETAHYYASKHLTEELKNGVNVYSYKRSYKRYYWLEYANGVYEMASGESAPGNGVKVSSKSFTEHHKAACDYTITYERFMQAYS